jgi:hypothetical protein
MPKQFWVVDLDPTGEIKLKESYEYDPLQTLPLAAMLIAEFATFLWRDPEGFDVTLPNLDSMTMRWRPSAPTAGIATLRHHDAPASVSLLAAGLDPRSDALTLAALQDRLVRQLHDTGHEPAFDLAAIPERPLVASVHLAPPPPAAPAERAAFALADRAFAAAYFRRLGLA